MPALFDAGWRLAEHPRFDQLYPEFLFALHSMMRAAVPLMEDALGRLTADPSAQESQLVMYLERHVGDEAGHDRWVLEDLQKLGVRREDVLRRTASPTIAGIVGAQYYWIRHHNPLALIGYVAVLEGYPPTVEAVDQLAARSGLPPAAFDALREHAAVDANHSAEIDRLFDELRLTEEQFELVCVNALMTVVGLVRCIDEILDDFDARASAHCSSEASAGALPTG